MKSLHQFLHDWIAFIIKNSRNSTCNAHFCTFVSLMQTHATECVVSKTDVTYAETHSAHSNLCKFKKSRIWMICMNNKNIQKKSRCMMNYANGNKTFIQSRSCKKYCCERNDCAHPGETVFKCGKFIWLCPTCSKKSMHMTLCMCPTNVDTNIKHIFVLESANETFLQEQPPAFKYLFAYAKSALDNILSKFTWNIKDQMTVLKIINILWKLST